VIFVVKIKAINTPRFIGGRCVFFKEKIDSLFQGNDKPFFYAPSLLVILSLPA